MTRLVRAVPHAEPRGSDYAALSERGVRRARLTPAWGLAIGEQRAPIRIQRRRTKGWTAPEGAVYVGRPTRWGNPFRPWQRPDGEWVVLDDNDVEYPTYRDGRFGALERAVDLYLTVDIQQLESPSAVDIRAALAGRDLMCWCRLDRPCHADVLLRIANTPVECTPWERCRLCRNAARCTADGQHAAAHAFLLQARPHHAEVGHVPDPPLPRTVSS